jgi:hypothetical protein
MESDNPIDKEFLSAARAESIRFMEQLLQAKDVLNQLIESFSVESNRSVRNALIVAYLRTAVALIKLPSSECGDAPTGLDAWKYWASHQSELQQQCAIGGEIASYLLPTGSKTEIAKKAREELFSALPDDVKLHCVPALTHFFAVPGAPVTRRPRAVLALQLRIDKKWTLPRITREVCDCGKTVHGETCQQVVRQSIRSLKKLLSRCGIELDV